MGSRIRNQTCLRADTCPRPGRRAHRQKGFTLTELVVALAIIGIMATAFTVTRAMITTSRVANAVQGVETVTHGATQFLMTSGKSTYAGISIAELVNQELVPSGIAAADANPWGGSYQISPVDGDSTFEVTLGNVPSAAGDRLVTTLGANATTTYDAVTKTFTAKYDKG